MPEFIFEREVYFKQYQLVIVQADTAGEAQTAVQYDDTANIKIIDAGEKKQDEIVVNALYSPEGMYIQICAEIDRIWEGLNYGSETALFNYRGGYYTGRQGAKDAWSKKLKVA